MRTRGAGGYMKWLIDGPLAAFDLETTGTDVENDRIVTAAVALLQPGTPWKIELKSYLVDPGIEIPAEATAIHGVSTEYAQANGEPAAQAIDMIAYWVAHYLLGRIPIVVCNGAYDFTLLDRECRRHDLPTMEERLGRPIAPVVDVHVLDKHIDPYRKGSRTLDALRQHYKVRHDGLHDAITDALAAARVAYRIALLAQDSVARQRLYGFSERYMGRAGRGGVVDAAAERLAALANVSAVQLHRLQIGWRAEQCNSLRAHFNRKGTAHDGVPGDWPMIAVQTEVPV